MPQVYLLGGGMFDKGLIGKAVDSATVLALKDDITVIVDISELLDLLDEMQGLEIDSALVIISWIFEEVEMRLGIIMPEKYSMGDLVILQSQVKSNRYSC